MPRREAGAALDGSALRFDWTLQSSRCVYGLRHLCLLEGFRRTVVPPGRYNRRARKLANHRQTATADLAGSHGERMEILGIARRCLG